MLRRLLPYLLVASLATGCASFGGGSKPRTLSGILESGELRVGMSGEQPPLNMTTRDGDVIGLEVALVRVLAQNMSVEAKIVRRPFGQLLDALEAGDVDMVMSGVAITPQRNLRAVFVGPYFVSGKSVLTKSKELASVAQASDLSRPGLRVAALSGSTSEEFVRRVLPDVTLVTSDGVDEAIRLVLNDQVDALVADVETCHFAKLRYPEAGLLTLAEPMTVEPMGIALSPDASHLANLLEKYLDALESTGVLQRARDYWFENDAWLQALR